MVKKKISTEIQRSYVCEITAKEEGKHVIVKGWVHDIRDLGSIKFILLKDITGIIQIVVPKTETPKKIFDEISKIYRESCIEVEGKVKVSKQAPEGREILPSKLNIISQSLPILPIDTSDFSKTEMPKRLDYRYLDLRNRKTQAIFKVQSEIAFSFREFFKNKNFIEIQPPCIISNASEGGTELFPVMYFEKPAYLAQSPQLYKQMAACSIEKVFSISPVWRAEKHNTPRHLNEIRQMDIEVAFCNQFEIMQYLGDVIQYIVKKVKEKCEKELKLLNLNLQIPESKFISYQEAIKLLKKNKVNISDGEDLTPEAEKKLSEIYPETIIFVHSWPLSLKPFYIMPKNMNVKSEDEESCGFDAIYGGIEISSGGQRIHLPDLLIKRIKAKGLNPEHFKSYIDSFRYGAPPHAGWSIGLERITGVLTKQENIRETCLFPRDTQRVTP